MPLRPQSHGMHPEGIAAVVGVPSTAALTQRRPCMSNTADSLNIAHIGFIGLGNMGSRMARRLLDSGYAVSVYDRTPEHAEPLTRVGAGRAASPSALAADSDVIILMLSNDEAV